MTKINQFLFIFILLLGITNVCSFFFGKKKGISSVGLKSEQLENLVNELKDENGDLTELILFRRKSWAIKDFYNDSICQDNCTSIYYAFGDLKYCDKLQYVKKYNPCVSNEILDWDGLGLK